MRCGAEVAPVRAEPRADAEQVTQAVRGEALRVEERRAGWARVRTPYDYPGWIREEVLCGDDPLSLARTFIGAPYEWGGLTAAGIDCSGLVHTAYRLSGRLVPRDSWQQEAAGAEIAEAELRPGDLVTYGSNERADHIAFWLGDRGILHSRGVVGVVEEAESAELRVRRRRTIRL
jgi:hypothetical protein